MADWHTGCHVRRSVLILAIRGGKVGGALVVQQGGIRIHMQWKSLGELR